MITKNVALPYHLIHVIPVNQKPRHCFKGYTQVSEIITTEKNIFPCKSSNPNDQIPLLCEQYSAQTKVCKISGLEFSCT